MENTEKVKPNQIYCGDSLEILSRMKGESVHCSVSSPPYFSLRKYQGAQTCEWPAIEYSPISGLPPIHIEEMTCALGHESTIEAYIGHLVAVYREVHRVLRNDGCAWLVMGDSYNTNAGFSRCTPDFKRDGRIGGSSDKRAISGLAQGDLMMVPHHLALALQADGWMVRNDMVWHKKSPMPESVSGWRWERCKVKIEQLRGQKSGRYLTETGTHGDAGSLGKEPWARYELCPGCPKCEPNGGYILKRGSWRHTRAHEFVFMLVPKMQYWANQEAAMEPGAEPDRQRGDPIGSIQRKLANRPVDRVAKQTSFRNPRSVLSPKPEPFSGRHFAVYPSTLIKPLIEATCPARCCPECGAGWAPIVERGFTAHDGKTESLYSEGSAANRLALLRQAARERGQEYQNTNKVLGYRPTCECGQEDHVPGVVLDPFVGSGTTCIVAKQLGRRWIGLDISEEYCGLARGRIDATQAPLFVL